MSEEQNDPLREQLEAVVGQPLGDAGPSQAPDEVNLPMIRHWVAALDDRDPVYLDADAAAKTRFAGIVAPPAMLQTWTMPSPKIEGIAERGGSPVEMTGESPLTVLDDAGFVATLATNSELEFDEYLRPGDRVQSSTLLESVSERKTTALGLGYFVTWVTTYTRGQGEVVGRQRFRILKFEPGSSGPPAEGGSKRERRPDPEVLEELPPFDLAVTSTLVVAGAIASRDFMPVHHDRDYAQSQGAPDIFMNILTTNGYVSRFVTDWAGPEARLRSIAIRLGAPAVPAKLLRFRGQVIGDRAEGDERVLEVMVQAANDLGNHATGTVVLTLPRP
jgi:acyl dehydratase